MKRVKIAWLWAYPMLICLSAAAIVVLAVQGVVLNGEAAQERATDQRQEVEIHDLQNEPGKLTFTLPSGVRYECYRAAAGIYTCATK